MRHLVFWIITVPLIVVLVDFTVMNMQEIGVNLSPLPWDVSVPLYVLVFGCVLIGILLGLLIMWRHGSAGRRRHRELNRQVNAQAGELESLRRNAAQSTATANTSKALVRADANTLVPPAI